MHRGPAVVASLNGLKPTHELRTARDDRQIAFHDAGIPDQPASLDTKPAGITTGDSAPRAAPSGHQRDATLHRTSHGVAVGGSKENPPVLIDHLILGNKAPEHAWRLPAQAGAPLAVTYQNCEPLAEHLVIARPVKQGVAVLNNLIDDAEHGSRDDGKAALHCLENHARITFNARRTAEDISRIPEAGGLACFGDD